MPALQSAHYTSNIPTRVLGGAVIRVYIVFDTPSFKTISEITTCTTHERQHTILAHRTYPAIIDATVCTDTSVEGTAVIGNDDRLARASELYATTHQLSFSSGTFESLSPAL